MTFSGNVLGGVGLPRFFLLSEDLITNGSFEDDDNNDSIPDNWAAVGATASRVADSTTVYGDYVYSVEDSDITGNQWVSQVNLVMPSGNTNGKTILIAFWVKKITGTPGGNTYIQVNDIAADGSAVIGSVLTSDVTTDWRLIWLLIPDISSGAGSPNFTINVYPIDPNYTGHTAKNYYDNFQVFEVESIKDISVEPQEYRNQGWDKELQTSRQRLIDGSYKEYVDGWRYRCETVWEYMPPADEIIRQSISDHSGLIGFMPHVDVDWGQICLWDGALNREYFFNRFLGHTSAIPLVGTEIMRSKPTRT